MKHLEEYRERDLSRQIIEQIRSASGRPVRIMEVCGTHTVSIFRNGIRSVLPETISLISGPGCPVCVTDQGDIDAFIELARRDNTIIATFGDLIRVPGTRSSLGREKSAGRDIRIVYSTLDALDLARHHPDKQVVFLGVGFETTAPTIAASILGASREGLENYCVYAAHKLVPPALEALAGNIGVEIDAFLLPGHVSVVIGTKAYAPFFEKYRIPCVIAGFEPADILYAIYRLVCMTAEGRPALENAYSRAVAPEGNPKARQIMEQVFDVCDARWRGLGTIPDSGLSIRKDFAAHDAARRFDIRPVESAPPKGCACGDILTGRITPPQCPLYKKACTPADPVGPCMVSSEGTCAAYYRYS